MRGLGEVMVDGDGEGALVCAVGDGFEVVGALRLL